MKYQDYINEYIQKGSFLKILNKKDIFFYDSTSIVLTGAIGLMFLLILLSLYITQISMMFGNIMLVIFLALFSLIAYLFLSSRFTKVLIAYEKEDVVNWEFIIIPKEIDLTISEKHSKMIGKKLIKVLVKRNNNYFGYDPYFFNDEIPVNPQELAAITEQSSIERLTTYVETSTKKEIFEKGLLLIILGGIGFLIFVLSSEIMAKI